MTLADVAALANVSPMTVSRVINRDPRVAARTFQRVQAVMHEVGYKPIAPEMDGRRRRGRAHQGLHTGRIAVLVPDTQLFALSTPLSVRWLRGVDRPLSGTGLQLVLTRLTAPGVLPNWIDRRQIDGVIVRSPSAHEPWLVQALSRMPTVWLFEPGETTHHGDIIQVDDQTLGRDVARHLLAEGHASVLVLDNMPHHLMHQARIKALRAQAGKKLQVTVVEAMGLDQAQTASLLAAHPRAAAIFIPGPGSLVAHVGRVLKGWKGRLPRLITCTADVSLLASLDVPVANLDIRPEDLGDNAGRLILRRIAQPDSPRVREALVAQWTEGPFTAPAE